MEKDMICIMCPKGCHLHIDNHKQVSGNFCPRGKKYALEEITNPKRVLTSTVKTIFKDQPRLSVKSKEAIPKALIFEAMHALNHVTVSKHVHIGDVVVHDLCHTGVDLIATKNIT